MGGVTVMLAGELSLQDRITDQSSNSHFDAHMFFKVCKHLGLEPCVWEVGEQQIKLEMRIDAFTDQTSQLVLDKILASALRQDPMSIARNEYARAKWNSRSPSEQMVYLG